MGAIRVQAFQGGGSMLFPGMPDQQVEPPAMQQPTVTPPGNSPLPPPAPAISTQMPAAPPEMPTDDNIELDKARREDEPRLTDDQYTLSHRGDNRFLTPKPQREDYRNDPEYETLQQARQYIQQNGSGQKPADLNRAISMVAAKEKALAKRYDTTFKDSYNQWKMAEVEALKDKGDKLTGSTLEQQFASAEEARNKHDTSLKAMPGQKGELERAGSAVTNLTSSAYHEAAVRIGQFNNLPPNRGAEILNFLASPNGPYNGRKGIAAANYKIAGRDVAGNVWLDTEQGRIRVPPNTYEQIEMARRKGYKAIQGLETKFRNTPPTRTPGQWIADQFK